MVEGNLGSFLKRLAEHHPVGGLILHSGYILPGSLHQKHITVLHLHTAEVVEYIIFLSSDTQHIDAELAAESGIHYGTVDH